MTLRSLITTFFIIAISGNTPTFSQNSHQHLDSCMAEVKGLTGSRLARVPRKLLAMDQKLYQMVRAVFYLEDSFERLKRLGPEERLSPLQRHMLGNAVESCLSFKALLEARSRRFLWLGTCMASLLTVLTLWLLLNIVPRPFRKVPADPKAFMPREGSELKNAHSNSHIHSGDPGSV